MWNRNVCGYFNVASHLLLLLWTGGFLKQRLACCRRVRSSFLQPSPRQTVGWFTLFTSQQSATRRGSNNVTPQQMPQRNIKKFVFSWEPRFGDFTKWGKKTQQPPTACEKSFQIVPLKCYDQQCIIDPRQRPIGPHILGSRWWPLSLGGGRGRQCDERARRRPRRVKIVEIWERRALCDVAAAVRLKCISANSRAIRRRERGTRLMGWRDGVG